MGDCYINAGSLESFVSNLKETQKQDVLDSSLLALKTQKHGTNSTWTSWKTLDG